MLFTTYLDNLKNIFNPDVKSTDMIIALRQFCRDKMNDRYSHHFWSELGDQLDEKFKDIFKRLRADSDKAIEIKQLPYAARNHVRASSKGGAGAGA